jgi:hypothetical protein
VSLEAARKAVEFLERNIIDGELGDPHLKQEGVTTFPLAGDGFRVISNKKSGRKFVFVDGGNQEIIGAPNFSIQLNRTYSTCWCGKNKENWNIPRIEFFSSTFSCFKKDEIHFETTIIPSSIDAEKFVPDAKHLSFSSLDENLVSGRQRAEIGRVGSVARRFGEWRLALNALDHLSEGDILVMDGTLQSNFTNEVEYVKDLSRKALQRGVILTGISKTSTIFTTKGLSLLGAVNNLAEKVGIKGHWYFPVAESTSIDHNVIIMAVKLNSIADRVFRFEIQREQYKELGYEGVEEIFSLLCENSCDPTFPGYPYGLIYADWFARVSFDEVTYYTGLLVSEISKLGKVSKFLPHIHSSDAHDVLNLMVR